MNNAKKKLRHDIIGDTEAVKNVLKMVQENLANDSLSNLVSAAIQRMDKIQSDFLKIVEENY